MPNSDVQEAALKHRITDLEDEELFIGAKLMGALGWTGRTATLDEIVEEVRRLKSLASPVPLRPELRITHHPFHAVAFAGKYCWCGFSNTHPIHGGADAR